MNRCFSIESRVLLALAVAVFIAGSAQAQSDGSNGSRYPYWGTAPGGYRGPSVPVPVPSPSSSSISNAAHSTPFDPERSVYRGVGGGFLPPFLTVTDTGSLLSRSDQMGTDNKAHIWLRLPANAEVWVNDVKTRQTGESRYFYSPPLTPGRQYSYQLRVRWMKDGKPVEETQRLLVHAGATVHRDFTRIGDEKNAPSSGGAAKK
jgi:uncharacterized protein (TIGR03000 family)